MFIRKCSFHRHHNHVMLLYGGGSVNVNHSCRSQLQIYAHARLVLRNNNGKLSKLNKNAKQQPMPKLSELV